MTSSSHSVSKNKAFSVVLFIELWERFGYYGMQSILILFLVRHMHFTDHNANLLMGAFAAMTYAAPILGGWVGDRFIGNKRAMLYGSIILALGYLLLAQATHHEGFIYLTMAIVSAGNGLFKPNAATLVRRIYENDDSSLDIAFTFYYMAVNVGSTVSMLLCPVLKDHFGWSAAFITCFIGLALGILNYSMTQKRLAAYLPAKDRATLSWTSSGLVFLGILATIAGITFILQSPSLTEGCLWGATLLILILWGVIYIKADLPQRSGLKIMYLLTLEGMFYYVFYQQMFTSLTLFAQRNVDPAFNLGPYHLFNWSAGQFQALNPIAIMILSPILAKLYLSLSRHKKDLSIAVKFIIGFAFVTLAFFIWWVFCLNAQDARVSSWVMIYGYFTLSLGELLTSGLGLAVIARYTPASMNGFMTGSYFLSTGIAMYIGSLFANIAAPHTDKILSASATLVLYQHLFLNLFIAAGIVLILLICLLPLVHQWDKKFRLHHTDDSTSL